MVIIRRNIQRYTRAVSVEPSSDDDNIFPIIKTSFAIKPSFINLFKNKVQSKVTRRDDKVAMGRLCDEQQS